jgi:hypothetical protein
MRKRKTHSFLRRLLCVGAIGFVSAGNSIALDNPGSPARQSGVPGRASRMGCHTRWGAGDLA